MWPLIFFIYFCSSEEIPIEIQFEFPEFNGIRLFCPIDELKKANALPNCTDSAFKKSECSLTCQNGQKFTDSRGKEQPQMSRCTCQRAQCNWEPPLGKCRSIGEVNKRKLMPKITLKSGKRTIAKKSSGWCVEFSQGQRSLVRSGKCFCPAGWKKIGGCVEPRVDRVLPCAYAYSTFNCTGNKLSEISQADENEGEVIGQIFDLIVPGDADEIVFKNSQLHVIPEKLLQGTYKLLLADFSNNFLKTIPFGLFDSTDLVTNIDFSFNQINFLPSGVFENLVNLEVLNLAHNNLKQINQNMGALVKLIVVDFSFNRLEKIDENDVVIPGSVEYLELQNNKISHMSPNIFPFALFNIDLSNNLLKDDFEDSFKGAPNLVGLNINNNFLERFPSKKYPALRRAELSGNQIQLTGAVNLGVKMPALEKLNLSKNKITNLPATFLPETCDSLKLINFKQNGLLEIANDELACERNDLKDLNY
ncbi:unnamed protein product [Oikopleura dioica]|uniref:EGF-like domain-containing protein n=1 Tax=Oikopleura dioica TaxID=34765 RepID=E4XUH7_OIKDI|nr:unnamed protein product [Oikopleura dioica]